MDASLAKKPRNERLAAALKRNVARRKAVGTGRAVLGAGESGAAQSSADDGAEQKKRDGTP
jgi:hypothetical protein